MSDAIICTRDTGTFRRGTEIDEAGGSDALMDSDGRKNGKKFNDKREGREMDDG